MDSSILTKVINVVIADDCRLLAKLIQSYLNNFFNLKLVGLAKNGNEVISLVENHQVDLILMDVMMPEMGGLETAKKVLEVHPELKIIFISGMNNKKVVQEALKLGAWGFITKNSSQEEIINAINTVISGEKYFDKDILNSFITNAQPIETSSSSIEALTTREKEILVFVMEEYSVNDIADKLCVSPRTVETHKRNIMSKLGVKSTVSLIKFVYENGLNVN